MTYLTLSLCSISVSYFLSSGELRKFQLTKLLLSNPKILIMDNPFIGLDAKTRELLHSLLKKLIETIRLQVILVLSKTNDIPGFITSWFGGELCLLS